jgi:DNA-binding CsgD family transcriptional regulator
VGTIVDGSKPLTVRERDVLLCRCADELETTDVGAKLGIRPDTVKKLSANAYYKLGVRTIAGACFRRGVRGAALAVVAKDGRRIA